jgi:acetylornithine deacetylase
MKEAERIAILERLVAFPTVSRDSNLDLVGWVERFLAGHGIASTRVPGACGRKAHLFASVGPDVPGGVILSGHSDVVPVDGQSWSTDPWRVVERDGRLHGRGTCDMKGFVALALAAMVRARSAPLARPLQLALSYDEELGCMAVIDLIEAMAAAGLPRADCVIVGEPTRMQVVTGQKGGAGYRVHVRGYEVHSSRLPEGVSAIMEAARLVEWVNRMNAQNAAAPPGHAAAAFDPPYTTLHVGMIEGGTAHNITARDCRFSLEFRVVPDESVQEWKERFETEAARLRTAIRRVRPEADVTLENYFTLPGVAPERNGAAEQLARALSGDNGLHVVSYGTEGGQFQTRGYSTVICGPGDIAQAHQADEYLELSEFRAGWRFMERLVATLAA